MSSEQDPVPASPSNLPPAVTRQAPAWIFDEPEPEWVGSDLLPDGREERLATLYTTETRETGDE